MLYSLMIARARQAAALLRVRSFDVSNPEGRSSERYRRVGLSALSEAVSRGITILTQLISIPLVLNYLGQERYGLWLTMSSLIAMIGFADLGMGNGLLNAISEANGRDDTEAAQRYVSSTFFMMLALALTLAAGFAVLYPFISWSRLFNISSYQAIAEAGVAAAVFVGCFLLNLILDIVQRVQLGYQEGFINSLWMGAGSLLGLGAVLLAIHLRAGLPWLILAMAGSPVLTLLLNALVLFGFRRRWLLPRWRYVTTGAMKRIFHIGILFVALQIAVAVGFTSDNIVAAQVLGPEAVTQYSVPMRLFSIIPLLLSMVVNPLWPAYGEAATRGDVRWVTRTLYASLCMVVTCSIVASAFMILFGAQLVRRWVGPQIIPSLPLLAGFGVWMVLSATGNTVAVFLNGMSIVRFQTISALVMAGCSLIAKILFAIRFGLPGIIWGTIIAYTFCTGIPITVLLRRLLSNTSTLPTMMSRSPLKETPSR